jgi:hypothetical protein
VPWYKTGFPKAGPTFPIVLSLGNRQADVAKVFGGPLVADSQKSPSEEGRLATGWRNSTFYVAHFLPSSVLMRHFPYVAVTR